MPISTCTYISTYIHSYTHAYIHIYSNISTDRTGIYKIRNSENNVYSFELVC